MKDQYSLIAPWYSSLVKLVFGKKLKQSKLCLLENTKAKRVLIIGGGDGLDYKEFASDISGEYWELSASMLKKAQTNLKQSNLDFHLGHFKAEDGKEFDEIWLHFLLDTMPDEVISSFLQELRKSLKAKGIIQFVDFFKPANLFQTLLNRMMITFFQVIAGHQRENIPDYERIFVLEKWEKRKEKEIMEGWVKAQIWRKLRS